MRMAEIPPGIPDYVPQFTDALERRGTPKAKIDAFIRDWRLLPPEAPKLPCPFCHAGGGWGALSLMPARNGILTVWCSRCDNTIVVNSTPIP